MKVITTMACIITCALSSFGQGKPLKVYILAGQSNMTGMVSSSTLEHVKMFPDTAKAFADLFDKDGNPVILDDVYVSQWKEKEGGKLAPRFGGGKGERFGPEYAFGVYMHKKLQEPILIIKTSQGGKDINYHFRPPSAGTWTPPKGHPDLIKKEDLPPPPQLPIPVKLDLPDDWTPGKDLKLRKRHMGLNGFKGAEIGQVNGVYPIYVLYAPREEIKGNPFQQGDLILGVDGSGFREDPIQQWRDAFYGSKTIEGDWMIPITRWRKGKIETFDFDICDTIEGGRAKLPEHIEGMKQAAIERQEQTGGFYRDMMEHVRRVLSDIKTYHPAYDPEAGYELAGFVWFQGYNDLVNGYFYPNRDKPRGYERYTWLLEHFIRDIRNDLDAPDLPFVIGVLGVGGIDDPPTSNTGYFQQAQAAVAEKPEFKDTVANVHAGKYWDHELEALTKKTGKTTREEEILKKAVSSQGYHYFGSAKIMCGIGKGFAEALINLGEDQKLTIGLIGDSTVGGWGPAFAAEVNEKAQVLNYAKSGGRLAWLSKDLDALMQQKPDYVLIQFGHNDMKFYNTRIYGRKLRDYVERVITGGGKPIILSSVTRREFDENGKIAPRIIKGRTLPEYAKAARAIAEEMNVPFMDLNTISIEHHNKIGPEASAAYNLTETDTTHFSEKGAREIARLIIKHLKVTVPELAPYFE